MSAWVTEDERVLQGQIMSLRADVLGVPLRQAHASSIQGLG